jgi:hypothetical protein
LTAFYEITKNHSLGSNFNVKGVPADYIKTANFALASGTITANASSGNFSRNWFGILHGTFELYIQQ